MEHAKNCPAHGNYQPPYEECICGVEEKEIIVDHDKNYIKPIELNPKYKPTPKALEAAYEIDNLEMLELLHYIYSTGYVSRENHQAIEDLKFEFESRLDNLEPGWSPVDIPSIVKKYRKEFEDYRKELEDASRTNVEG